MTVAAEAPRATARRALDQVEDGQVLGLGTGRAAVAFVEALGERVREGLHVTGVPTSISTGDLARRLGIPLTSLAEARRLDVAFDGADEVAPDLALVKGYGGALVREKIVAASADRFVVLVSAEKLMKRLSEHGRIPVEMVPYRLPLCRRRLEALGFAPALRERDQEPYVTDNGNWILDCGTGPLDDPPGIERAMLEIPGVVGTGLFVGMASMVLVQEGETVRVMERGE